MKRQVVREGIERVTILHCKGEGIRGGVYRIRRASGDEEVRTGPTGLTGDVTVRLLRVEGVGSKRDMILRFMETSA